MAHRPWPIFAVAISVLLLACSSAPPTSDSNKHMTDARASFKSSDFDAAMRNLDKAIKTAPNDADKQQAIILRTVLVTAMADANKQMAEAYYVGAKQPLAQAHNGPFYKQRSDYYSAANSNLMDAMQSVMNQRSKLGGPAMPLEIVFPGFMGTNPGMTKIKSGMLLSDSERLSAEMQADRNALALVLSAIAGAGQDPHKGQQVYVTGKVEIDPRVYIIELSNSFLQTGEMFGPRGLNEADHQRTVTEVVHANLELAEKMLAEKPDKELEARLKKCRADCDKGTAAKKK
jgi:hypothetical protein